MREHAAPESDTIRTPRLNLEPIEEAHARALFLGLRNDALYEFLDERPPESVDALAERYRRLSRRVSPDGREAWLNWALWEPAARRYVGTVQATVHPGRSAHVAYVLFEDAWGQGLAREAIAAMIEHLRAAWGVRHLLADVDPRNRRSIALLEALGFGARAPRGGDSSAFGRQGDLAYERALG
ncbi:MAG: GNAT family N-acetyltransferase [Hyphomicrobiales bacterium]